MIVHNINFNHLINSLNGYLMDLEFSENNAKIRGDILEQGIIILQINGAIELLKIIKDINKGNYIIKVNYDILQNTLNSYLYYLENKYQNNKIKKCEINDVHNLIELFENIMNKKFNNNPFWNSTPDNICWVLDDDAEKAILYFDLGENIESGRYLIIGGNNIDKFINKEKFDYWVSDNIFPIDKTYSMELTQEEVELIKKHRNENK